MLKVGIVLIGVIISAEITKGTDVVDEGTATRSHRRRRSGQPKSNTVSLHSRFTKVTKEYLPNID